MGRAFAAALGQFLLSAASVWALAYLVINPESEGWTGTTLLLARAAELTVGAGLVLAFILNRKHGGSRK